MYKALTHMHSKYICHGDFKLANIFVKSHHDFRLVLGDFGLSNNEESVNLNILGGTLGFQAPELFNGLTEKCDVYSFGKSIIQLIIGTKFKHNISNEQLMEMVATSQPKISSSLIDLIKKMIKENPEERLSLDQVGVLIRNKNKPKQKQTKRDSSTESEEELKSLQRTSTGVQKQKSKPQTGFFRYWGFNK
ncbi:predicted protein [Naegleria gruberi]|uniref:Predicted protein n=1 Tax=Naegleria gruberi TaxID=5762 RepID=D2VGK1_NAEGR|nr:uncharacterized protein NAEGRDRAFT_68007 [Naegleria gruberi]EFC43979.1 predicted protein [Naegleria gruberi]|eukprot:XP_002676723.1 predicted protein [Naegleria gruberi strain NEG-M]